jgi:hypothetical protein
MTEPITFPAQVLGDRVAPERRQLRAAFPQLVKRSAITEVADGKESQGCSLCRVRVPV